MQRPGRGLLLCATPAANASRAHAENAALKYSGGIQRESVKGNEQKIPVSALLGLLKYAGRAGPCLLPPGVVPPRERAWPRGGGAMHFVSGAWWKKDRERRHKQEWGDFLRPGEVGLRAEQLPAVALHLCRRRATAGPFWVVSPGDAASTHTYLGLRGSRNRTKLPRNPPAGHARGRQPP